MLQYNSRNVPAKYPSWEPERQKAYRAAYLERYGRAEIRARKREFFRRNRARILAEMRERYKADPDYRERMKVNARRAIGTERVKEYRKKEYWDDPETARRKAREWYRANREYALKRNAAYRARTRETRRAHARSQSANLTESYVRNQLAKNSPLSTTEFPSEMVELKRQHMLARKEIQNQ